MASLLIPSVSSSMYPYRRQLIDGEPSTPSEVSIAYIDAQPAESHVGAPKGTILLIHGFPQTSHQFRKVIPLFLCAGYRIVAPDYRGAGHSSKPRDGYEKKTVASDLYRLLRLQLGIREPVHVVGHDIGGMVAHAYATQYPDDTASVVWGECPLPGTQAYEGTKHAPGCWHFTFHWQTDLPEALVSGREAIYIRSFYDRLSFQPDAIAKEDVDVYAWHFSQPGAMRAGFDMYRAFHRDAEDNRKLLMDSGKCKVRCASLFGDRSFMVDIAREQAEEVYEHVETRWVRDSGHWCAEENPEDFVKQVLEFIESTNGASQSAEAAESTATTKPVEKAKSIEVAQLADDAEPTDNSESVEVALPAEVSQPTEVPQPTEASQTTEAAQSIGSPLERFPTEATMANGIGTTNGVVQPADKAQLNGAVQPPAVAHPTEESQLIETAEGSFESNSDEKLIA